MSFFCAIFWICSFIVLKYCYLTECTSFKKNKIKLIIANGYEVLDVKSMKETDTSIRNKRVGDVSWSEFRRMLTYKSQWYGRTLSVVDRYFPSSQICHCCGFRSGKKSEDIRCWTCPECGTIHDRDINAAINILNEGLRLLNV